MKAVLISGLSFIIYGYACRFFNIYFFWESRSIGWGFLLIGFIGLLMQRIKMKKLIRKEATLEKIGIGVIIFILFAKVLLLSITPFTDAYTLAKAYVMNDRKLQGEIGTINSLSIVPLGGISKSSNAGKDSGYATLTLILKGEKKFKEVTIAVAKSEDQEGWVVQEIQ